MEEILASIRRIISEDDAPAAASAAAPAPEPEPAAQAAPEPHPAPQPTPVHAFDEGDDDDVLDLTEPAPPLPTPEPVRAAPPPAPAPAPRAEPPAAESLGDLDVFSRPEPARPAPRPEPAAAASTFRDDEGLISPPAADLAASAFGQLSRTLAMPAEGRTLEDVVRELLRPMLKDWLDRNLTGIVESAVQAEVERISRQRRF